MAKKNSDKPISDFYILNYDKEVIITRKISLLGGSEDVPFRKILKGTLLRRFTLMGANSDWGNRIWVQSLDDDYHFECRTDEVSPLQPEETYLLIALSSRSDRIDIYQNHIETLRLGLTLEKGAAVSVQWEISDKLENVAGIVRYKGELVRQKGIFFGIELEEYRGSGTSDGVFRRQHYFSCDQDCGVFVSINKLMKRNRPPRKEKRFYGGVDPEARSYTCDLHLGQRVSIFTDEGQKGGVVEYCGTPLTRNQEYVGIKLDSRCNEHEVNDGTLDGHTLFYPTDATRTLLVPRESVFPEDNLERQTGTSRTVTDKSHFDYTCGDRVSIDTQQDGVIEGVVLWIGTPGPGAEPHVGIELDQPRQNLRDISDGTYKRRRLFYPKYSDRTVLVPAASVWKSLSPEMQKDSLNDGHDTCQVSERAEDQTHRRHQIASAFTLLPKSSSPHLLQREDDSEGIELECSKPVLKPKSAPAREIFTVPDSVINAVARHHHGQWKRLAKNLCFNNRETIHIADVNSTTKECMLDMLRRWREQMSSSRDKLGPLIMACRKTGFRVIANELEQGLDEQMLHYVAESVHESAWNVLGQGLGLDWDHLIRLQMEDSMPRQRVYHMLLDWRVQQPFETDKDLMLANALNVIGMQTLALEVCRGLTSDLIQHLTNATREFWKHLGSEMHLTENDLHDLDGSDSIEAANKVLVKWKRRQDIRVDLLGTLAEALNHCQRTNLADLVIKGMDDALLCVIANMIGSKAHNIASALHIPMQVQFGEDDGGRGSEPAFATSLKWWRANRVLRAADGQRELYDVLVRNGFEDAAQLVLPGMGKEKRSGDPQ